MLSLVAAKLNRDQMKTFHLISRRLYQIHHCLPCTDGQTIAPLQIRHMTVDASRRLLLCALNLLQLHTQTSEYATARYCMPRIARALHLVREVLAILCHGAELRPVHSLTHTVSLYVVNLSVTCTYPPCLPEPVILRSSYL
jgi:hypothetical protein